MSLPPRSAKQMAFFQLQSGQERIFHDEWTKHKPRKRVAKSVEKKESPINVVVVDQPTTLVTMPKTTLTSEPIVAKTKEATKGIDIVSNDNNGGGKEHANESKKLGNGDAKGEMSTLKMCDVKDERKCVIDVSLNKNGAELPKDSANTNGKKEDTKIVCVTPKKQEVPAKGSAWEYSLRPKCKSVKLAKMIQLERNKIFTYTKQNLFPPGRPSRKPNADDASVCSCYLIEGMTPCGDHNCMNRLVSIECNAQFCPCGDKCANQRFQRNQYAAVIPFKTDNKGWGLKTLELLQPQQFVFEYCGEVINNEVCRQRLEANPDEDNFYYITLDRNECIDASCVGNLARFMNHSCNPNCQTQKWAVNGELRIGLFAKHEIPAGSELTFDYNFERFGSKKQKCYCGTPNCRGYLGAKPKHLEADLKRKNGKRKPASNKSKRAKLSSSGDGGDLTLLEQNWGLPPPQKKARVNFTVDHMRHVETLLTSPESEAPHPRGLAQSHLYLRRNVNLVRKGHFQYLKNCVSLALSSSKKSKFTPSKPPVSTPTIAPPVLTASPLPPIPIFNVISPAFIMAKGTPSPQGAIFPANSPPSTSTGQLLVVADAPVKKEGPAPISARRRKRKVVIRRSASVLDALNKMGILKGFVPGDFIKALDSGVSSMGDIPVFGVYDSVTELNASVPNPKQAIPLINTKHVQ